MALVPMLALVRKDLQLFFSDRRSVILSFVVPIAIASFFGSIFSGPATGAEQARIDVAIVDQDDSAISRGIVASARGDKNLVVTTPTEAEATEAVKTGGIAVAVVIPKGFGDASGSAFFGGGQPPTLDLKYDPTNSMELAMVRGVLTQHVMQAVSREMFGGEQGRQIVDRTLPEVQGSAMPDEQKRLLSDLLGSVQKFYGSRSGASGQSTQEPTGITVPYVVREQAMTSGNVAYNGYAHSFAGMAIQFLLFAMANLGIEMLLERQRGLWKRLRSAPISKLTLLGSKVASGTVISLLILLGSFAFAIVVFRVRIHGSIVGFACVAVACALMASTFGLLVASLGNTPATARGVTTLAVMMMVMLGGAWVPTFVFPAWVQQVTRVVPVRWAVDGFDAMTWRGLGLAAAVTPTLVLCGFSVLFAIVAAVRFRWEEA